jgi:signal transduction histidine kinase
MPRRVVNRGSKSKPRGGRGTKSGAAELRGFEEILSEMSAALVRAAADEIDREIKRWHERIVLALDLDRSSIGEISADHATFYVAHQWTRPGLPGLPLKMSLETRAPWLTQRLLAGETVVFSDPDDLPREFAQDLKRMGSLVAKSGVVIPLRVGGVTVGAIGFDSLKKFRTWSPQPLRRMRRVADIFASALERKDTALVNARLREELTHVSRAATMGELAASLAHELNQPLAAILNNAEAVQSLLQSERLDLEEIKAAIEDIIADDVRAGETIQRLRAFFRREELRKTPLDVVELVGGIGRMVRSDAVIRNIAFTFDAAPAVPQVAGDRIQLQQAILNLILNAFDAAAESRSRAVAVEVRQQGSASVKVVVRDSGKGIEPDAIPRVFEAFFTTKPGGMGMGLAISRSIVEAHGGRLSASSRPGRGATFEVALPVLAEARG